jgi:P pilus assembly chaperone PapD
MQRTGSVKHQKLTSCYKTEAHRKDFDVDVAALATSILSMQAGQTQMMVAATMMQQNAKAEAAVVQILNGGSQSASSLANVAAGVGGNLDISA